MSDVLGFKPLMKHSKGTYFLAGDFWFCLAMARLNAAQVIPEWATRSSFFSISKTSDELSIVRREADVPSDVKCEINWIAIKVKGPLDFAITGILASLVDPLARAGVSIFAISTFDTDYVLAKEDKIVKASRLLTESGHMVQTHGGEA